MSVLSAVREKYREKQIVRYQKIANSLGLQPSELNFIDSDSTFGP